ncbi:hypothetical protein [Mastigocladopsis repens]|uniref:hypothetical protein n=1 Tax=Mastigocladopsis repens TaxID=221287 RepID=UPI0018DD0EF8|nr:hypothetical protein [Mastigocladopsis repens]
MSLTLRVSPPERLRQRQSPTAGNPPAALVSQYHEPTTTPKSLMASNRSIGRISMILFVNA